MATRSRRSRATRRRCRPRSPSRRRRSTSRRARCASSGRSCATPPRSRSDLDARRGRAARRAAGRQPRARGRHAGARAARSQLNDRLQRRVRRAAATSRGADHEPRAARPDRRRSTTLNPQLRFLGPYVTVCNYWNYFWTFAAEHLSEDDATGTPQRALLNSARRSQATTRSARSGRREPRTARATPPDDGAQYLHGEPYGAAIDAQGKRRLRGRPARLPAAGNRCTATRRHGDRVQPRDRRPGRRRRQGPTFKQLDSNGKGVGLGPARVPQGETFTARPAATASTPKGGQP